MVKVYDAEVMPGNASGPVPPGTVSPTTVKKKMQSQRHKRKKWKNSEAPSIVTASLP